jgi:HD-like signal output (HDOD) protein
MNIGTTMSSASVVEEIMDLVNNSGTSIAKLSAVLMKEPTLMRNILRKANTPMFGIKNRIKSVDMAIVLLGFDALKKTVAGALINGALRKMVDALFRYDEYWNHSVACAVIARYLAERAGRTDADGAFIAGLFHDIGFLVIHQPDHGAMGVSSPTTSALMPPEETGALIAARWQLPEGIVEAIRFQHEPERAIADPVLAAIVHVANVLCHTTAIARFKAEEAPVWSPKALEILNLGEEDLRVEHIMDYDGSLKQSFDGAHEFHGKFAGHT